MAWQSVPQLPAATLPKPAPPAPPAPPGPRFPSTAAWSVTVDAAPLVPPIVAGRLVLLALQTGTLTARHLPDGKEAWHDDLRADGPMTSDAGRVFVVSGQTLHALNSSDGATAWTVAIGQPTAAIVARGGWVIVARGSGIDALRASDGSKVWSRETGAVSERAAIAGDALYVPVTGGRLLALDLTTGAVRWDRKVGADPTEPLVYDGRVYFGSSEKQFVCLKAASGSIDWAWNIGSRTIGAAAADSASVYVVAMDNLLRALNRTNGGQRWTYPLVYRPTSGPVVMGAQVSVPGITSELTGIAVATGKPTGKVEFPVKLAVGPAFVPPDSPEGSSAVVSVAGGLTNEWTLAVWKPGAVAPPPVPAAPQTPVPAPAQTPAAAPVGTPAPTTAP